MANLDNLRSQGWHLTSEGLNKLCENEKAADIRSVTRRALDEDIRDIGAPILSSELNKSLFGPVVLQIVKIRNISAPKSKPNSQAAPRMLKLILTDGHTNCQGIEIKQMSSLNLDKTAPGTKIYINGAQIVSGSLLLLPECCKVLGGHVAVLVEKWEVSKLMPTHVRVTEDGPPAWVNFGKKIVTNINNQGFKSLENKNKENTKENAEFQVQRQDAIAEATQGAVKKVFGGGVKPVQTFNASESNYNHNSNQRAPRQPRNKGKDKVDLEKIEKPSQRVSLFDFLEDKLPVTEPTQPKNNFNTKVFNNYDVPPTTRPARHDYNDNPPPPQRKQLLENFTQKQPNKDTAKFKHHQNNFNSYRQDNEPKPKQNTSDNRYQNDRPPRFQRQKPENNAKSSNNHTEPRSKPNTNNFVDKLTTEINNISLYNSKYETEKLHKPANKVPEPTNATWKWKIGDRCMAKYWEDNKFYNAIVTGITNKTCMVEFIEYGNFEEVLHCDCIPIMSEKQERQHVNKSFNDNQQFSGSLEFRRGKSRPFVRTPNKTQGQNRNYES